MTIEAVGHNEGGLYYFMVIIRGSFYTAIMNGLTVSDRNIY